MFGKEKTDSPNLWTIIIYERELLNDLVNDLKDMSVMTSAFQEDHLKGVY